MTHAKPMNDSDGAFGAGGKTALSCRKCGIGTYFVKVWTSHCGGYVDHKYTCGNCGHYWWSEGPDA